MLVSANKVVASSSSAATEIKCWPGPSRFSRTTTHSPFASAVVLPSNSVSSKTLMVAPGGALPATTAAPSGFTRAISMRSAGSASCCISSDDVSDVAESSCCSDVFSSAACVVSVWLLGRSSIDCVCGATSAVSSSAKNTTPSASATSIPPTPKSM